ncbi:MAG TPA: NHLP bacteriocin system secretion protein, partial [Spirochaetota bacterium]|nr:NHLP bacteriocin system secretion protein [Spirochaetota bacterium]
MDKSIFRKVSLERLSSPEKIDQLLYITNPYAWVSLFGILLILAFVIIWSFFGEIPVEIEGNGMLMKAG